MKTIRYSFFCEDHALKIFLNNFLKLYPKSVEKRFVIEFLYADSPHFSPPLQNKLTKKDIKNTFVDVIEKAFNDPVLNLDAFFIGADLDRFSSEDFENEMTEMRKEIPTSLRGKTIIFLPVQCIEHWLWYLKDNAKTGTLEKQPRHLAKKEVYGKPKVSNKISDPIVETLTKEFNLELLASRSYSFNHFYKETKKILDQ